MVGYQNDYREEMKRRQEVERKLQEERKRNVELEKSQARTEHQGMIVPTQTLLDILMVDRSSVLGDVNIAIRKGSSTATVFRFASYMPTSMMSSGASISLA